MKKKISKNKKKQKEKKIIEAPLPPAFIVLNSSSFDLSVVVHNPPRSWEEHGGDYLRLLQ